MEKQKVGETPISEKPDNIFCLLTELSLRLENGFITPSQLGDFLKKENPLIGDLSKLITDWRVFYHDLFGIEVDFSGLTISKYRDDFNRLLIIAKDMTPQRLFDKCNELFSCWKWSQDNLDKVIISDRTAKNGAYAIWVRNRVEADEELENLPANVLRKKGIAGITLEEQLIFELKFFCETGRHLNNKDCTLCAGSYYCTGDSLYTNWNKVGLGIHLINSGYASKWVRCRQVVF
jgi:hypothetical protein